MVVRGAPLDKIIPALLAWQPASTEETCPICGGSPGDPPTEPAPPTAEATRPEHGLLTTDLITTVINLAELYAEHGRDGCPELHALDAAIAPDIFGWWLSLGVAGQDAVRGVLCAFVTALDDARQVIDERRSHVLVALSADGRQVAPKPKVVRKRSTRRDVA
jgi:hypothetical protein